MFELCQVYLYQHTTHQFEHNQLDRYRAHNSYLVSWRDSPDTCLIKAVRKTIINHLWTEGWDTVFYAQNEHKLTIYSSIYMTLTRNVCNMRALAYRWTSGGLKNVWFVPQKIAWVLLPDYNRAALAMWECIVYKHDVKANQSRPVVGT